MEGKQHEHPRSQPSARARSAVRRADFAVTPSLAALWQVLRDIWLRHLGAAFALETELRTLVHLAPLAVGLGIAAYFASDREPLWWGPAAALMRLGTSAFAIGRPVARSVLVALCAAMAGIAAGQWRTERVLVPSLDRVSIAKLSGYTASVEPRNGDMRLVMLVTAFGTLDSAQLP
jgi:hypothetical protein